MTHKKKLIEVALPLEAINKASAREKSIRHGHPSTLHLWWARRPLAAARAVIFAQMVDDPSSLPDLFPTEAKQQKERERLFKIIEELVQWENTTNEAVLEKARAEIWQSWRRACRARKEWREERKECGEERSEWARDEELFNPDRLPAFHDPFAGGGALPLEAQRLGLEAHASDLNPVAVLINKAMIEIPPRFAGRPPVNPAARKEWRQVRNEYALPGNDGLAKGDASRAGGVSPGATPAEGRDLRNAIADHPGGGVDSGEHRRGLDPGIGQGEGAVSGSGSGLTGGGRNLADPVRAGRLVPSGGNPAVASTAGRSEPDVDDSSPQVSHPLKLTPRSSQLFPREWKGAQGLAEDVRFYGQWMRDEAEKRIGHLYPKVRAWRDPRSGRYFGEAEVEEWRRSQKRGERNEYGEEVARECGHPSLSSLLSTLSSHELTVIAWLWARTVKSPNPAFAHVDVPLASTFMLSTKAGKEAYVEVLREMRGESGEKREESEGEPGAPTHSSLLSTHSSPSPTHSSLLSTHSSPSPGYRFTVKVGKPKDAEAAKNGTSAGKRAAFKCVMSGTPLTYDYIRTEGQAGRMGARLMATVAEGERGRVYLAPTPEHEAAALKAKPEWKPETPLHGKCRVNVSNYGFDNYGDLFTPRQLVALTTFSDLVGKAMAQVRRDALAAGLPDDPTPLRDGGTGAQAYAEAVGVYLAFALSKQADLGNSLCRWEPIAQCPRQLFGRQAIPMVWDYAEGNPLGESSGAWIVFIDGIVKAFSKAFEYVPATALGFSRQADAGSQVVTAQKVVSTDPPYYDNIGYADLSDFFYVWLRRSLRPVFPDLFATLAVPKAEELVATPYRHGSKEQAEAFFLEGMTKAMRRLAEQAHPAFPVTIYYAFKQQEVREAKEVSEEQREKSEGEPQTHSSLLSTHSSSTGWETFLDAVIRAGFGISGTWPMRTENDSRMIGQGTNALASSIVLVCRKRPENAPTATRREFVAALKSELPTALRRLQEGNIAPVDLAQAAIGPGMAVYTRYAKVLDAEGKPVPVREALALINQVLGETLAEQEGDFDADSRFAIAWFEQHGFSEGEFGVADVLARAKNTSVDGLREAGILASKRGKVRLLKPAELEEKRVKRSEERVEAGALTPRSSHWSVVHHLIRALEAGGEGAAAALVAKLGSRAETARELAYRLYTVSERKKRAAEALSYNALVQSWPEIARLAREGDKPRTEQATLFNETKE